MPEMRRSHRVEILNAGRLEAAGHGFGRNDGGHRMPVTHGFPDGYDVGHYIRPVQLERPIVWARSAETHLNLVRNAHAARFSHIPIRRVHDT